MKIFLAAAESGFNHSSSFSYNRELSQANLFLSYFYKKNTINLLKKIKEENLHKGIRIIDSGAHTFFGYEGIYAVKTYDKSDKENKIDVETYFNDYIEWLKEYYDYYDYFIELDLQEIFGLDRIKQWRQKIIDNNLDKKCIFVWHNTDSYQELDNIINLSSPKYIAVEGLRTGQIPIDYKYIIKQCYFKNCKIHGFAFTRQDLLKKFPFYSVDSSSWLGCLRYGKLHVFSQERIKAVPNNLENFLKYNIPIDLHNSIRTSDANVRKMLFSATAYLKFEKYITAYWEKRGVFWKE